MARRGGILKSLARSCKSKATNSAKQGLYMLMWGKEPPKGKKKTSGKKKKDENKW